MLGRGGILSSAIFNIALASMVMITGTAAARPGSYGGGHAQRAMPSGAGRPGGASNSSPAMSAPWFRGYGRDAANSQAGRPPAADRRWPAYSSPVNVAPHAGSSRADAPGAQSPQLRNDYRPMRADSRQAAESYGAPSHSHVATQPAYAAGAPVEAPSSRNDYRQNRNGGSYAPVSYAVPASAPVLIQPAYANTAVPGYMPNMGSYPLPVAGLIVDAISALAEYMRAGEMDETDPGYDQDDPGYGSDDRAR